MKQLWQKLRQALAPWLPVCATAYSEWLNKELDKSAEDFDAYLKQVKAQTTAELAQQELNEALALLGKIHDLKLDRQLTPGWMLEQARDPAPTLERCQNPAFLVTAYLAPDYRCKP